MPKLNAETSGGAVTFPKQPRLGSGSPDSVLITGNGLCMQIRAVGPDLLRLRMSRGRELSKAPSWAVIKPSWPNPDARVFTAGPRVGVETSHGRLTWNTADGSWELVDHHGLVVFAGARGGTGFAGPQPRARLVLQEEEALFGLGESSGTFNKRGLIREFWNIDVGGHARSIHANLRNMYLSIPFALSMRHGRAAGLFWDNPARQSWDLGQTELDSWKMSAISGDVDLYLFLGPTCGEVLERFTELTGRMPLPPQWALGYHQCRYSYETADRVDEIARTFRRRRIPCDAIYFDIHYMDGYRVFTFGKSFPEPRRLIGRLAAKGFKVITIIDPGVKDDSRFPVLRRGIDQEAYVKAADGITDYVGEVWPGKVRFPDFLHSRVRAWWGEEQRRFQQLGVSGFWNDMNEPADFSGTKKDFPLDCVHDTDFGPQPHAAVHNVYGSQMARASYDGALAAQPDRRPFIITRAGYAGVQRHALVWTGDNDSSWEHLADSVQMLLNLSLSGVPFCGADAGGFHYNATGELLARWTQLAALTPFFRNHSNIGTIDQEPWAFGERIEAICRRYIELRYQLLPYLYGLFFQAHHRGTPIIRPLFWQYQNDPLALAAGDQFMLGPELIIAPILRQAATARSVYLPAGIWFNFWTGETFRGGRHILAEAKLETMPIFVRAGAMLPMIPAQQFVGERKQDSIVLHIWPGDSGELEWYEDDGVSFGYERGARLERRITFERKKTMACLRFHTGAGQFPSPIKSWKIVLRNSARAVRAQAGKSSLPVQFDREFGYCAFDVANQPEEFEVRWR